MKIENYDTELDELKSCPFCGNNPIAYLIGNNYTKTASIVIKCPKCLIQRKISARINTIEWLEEKAISLWNERK